ncbi:WD40-repeat-containing domain protein, partial [Dimargaris cristalligena]
NFFQRATWSPDGSFLLTSSNDQCARVFQLPTDTLTTAAATGSPEPLEAFQCLRQSHGILALDWYPHVDYYHPSTWCFVSSTRDHPVHLWNAYTGKVQATYWAEDDKGQKIAAYALAFHPDGQSLYTGYHDAIHIFDVQRPGMARQTVRLTPTRNSKAGQKGIVSTIAFNPDRSGLYAVGTFSNSVGLYADTAPGALLHLKRPPIGNGLSQCQFSPCGNYLYLTGRTHYSVFCWDIRQTGKFLFCIDRTLGTSQRISFDVDPTGQFLASGTREGTVQIYDISGPLQAQPVTKDPLLVQSFPGHHDAIGATQFHPTLPLMATCSGQR